MSNCFYCGSNEHSSSGCVQKADIQDIAADAINQLGYSSMPRVVELFSEHKSGSMNIVSAAIYELSYGFRQESDEEMWRKDSSTEQHLLDYVISVTRGFVNIESGYPEAAISEFEDALNKAPAEVYAMRARLLKAQSQYSAGDVDAAVLTITEGMENLQQISSEDRGTYDYQLSRYYAAKSEAETSISYLKQLIEGEAETEGDKQYFVKALIDSHFDDSREAINEYLDRLQKQRKDAAQEMMELAEASIVSAKNWDVDIEHAESKLEQARQQFETESYYGYLDAQSLAQTSRSIAAKAEEEQRGILTEKASEAQQSAREAMTPAQELLTRLGNPQKQLQLFHEQFQHFEDAKNHLAESQEAFTLDNYRGYILSVEEAERTTSIANKVQRDVEKLLKREEEVEEAITNARVSLKFLPLQYPQSRRENREKYESAEALLTEAKQYFRKYTKDGYEQCLKNIQKANQLVDELNQDAKFQDLRQETKEEIDAAVENLTSIEIQFQGQYDPHKFQFAQAKLEEARGFCELRTMEGYSRAIDCTKEANQLADEMKEDVELQNLKETALREIENARVELMTVKNSPQKEASEARLDEMLSRVSDTERCTTEMCEKAIELTREIKRFIKQLEEDAAQKKRRRRRSIITISGFLGSSVVFGVLGALFWNPAALLCFLVGGVCYAIQVTVNRETGNDVSRDA